MNLVSLSLLIFTIQISARPVFVCTAVVYQRSCALLGHSGCVYRQILACTASVFYRLQLYVSKPLMSFRLIHSHFKKKKYQNKMEKMEQKYDDIKSSSFVYHSSQGTCALAEARRAGMLFGFRYCTSLYI